MNRYAIYSISTGDILRIVTCYGDQALGQLSSGEALVPAPDGVTDVTHHVVEGVLVPLG